MLKNFADYGIGVWRIQALRKNASVEIAVGAFRAAERHLDVDAEIHAEKVTSELDLQRTAFRITGRRARDRLNVELISCR